MVDLKPSVRFDLVPKLDLDLSLNRSSLEKEKEPASGSWAKWIAAALLNRSRNIKFDTTDNDKHGTVDRDKMIPPVDTHQNVGIPSRMQSLDQQCIVYKI